MAINGRASGAKAGWKSAIESANAQIAENGPTMRNFSEVPDALEILPDAVRGKLVELREIAENSTAAYRSLDEVYRHLQLEKIGAETRLAQLTDVEAGARIGYRHINRKADRIFNEGDPHDGEDPAIVMARNKAARATAEFNALASRRAALGERQQRAGLVVDICERYLGQARHSLRKGEVLPAFEGKVRKLPSVEAARLEIDKIRAAIDATYTAPIPSSIVRARSGPRSTHSPVMARRTSGRQ